MGAITWKLEDFKILLFRLLVDNSTIMEPSGGGKESIAIDCVTFEGYALYYFCYSLRLDGFF